jgi:hypothetical protein
LAIKHIGQDAHAGEGSDVGQVETLVHSHRKTNSIVELRRLNWQSMSDLFLPYAFTRAAALGIPAPVSPLLIRAWKIKRTQAGWAQSSVADWLLALANERGYRAAVPARVLPRISDPGLTAFPNEEVAIALMHPSGEDRPRLLRLAAQMISRGGLSGNSLVLLARREGAARILAELARLALCVNPEHADWQQIAAMLRAERPLRVPLLHWTRLAEPVVSRGFVSDGWRLAG